MTGISFNPGQLAEQLAALPPTLLPIRRYWVAFSGGLDSSVLLHALVALRSSIEPQTELRAVHINHGLHAQAPDWAEHCAARCRVYDIPLQTLSVHARAAPGESPEAAARQARYRAIVALLEPGDCLLTAHHQDDQAETLLLQLLRGAGPAGLAAMPAVAELDGGNWHARPLLAFPRQSLREYALTEQLNWIEDGSNSDDRYDRNFLRQHILPLLQQRWPAAPKTLARAAAHQADALQLIETLAEQDYSQVIGTVPRTVSVPALKLLPSVQCSNVLRYWLKRNHVLLPSAAVLEQMLAMLAAGDDRLPLVEWGCWQIRRYGDALHLLNRASVELADEYDWPVAQPTFVLEELGLELRLADLYAAGIQLSPQTESLCVRFRVGGERVLLPGRSHSHSLKKLLQERKVPPWLRERLPMVYEQDRLLAVFGLDPPIIAG
jgi:tRNA(Ile)-lysidine synthase